MARAQPAGAVAVHAAAPAPASNAKEDRHFVTALARGLQVRACHGCRGVGCFGFSVSMRFSTRCQEPKASAAAPAHASSMAIPSEI